MSSKLFDVEKPWKYKNWLIWPRTVLSAIQMSDCNDAPKGVCYRDLTIKECLEKCVGDDCGAGLYARFSNGKSICSPLRTSIHPWLNPAFRLRRQEFYPEIASDDVEVSIFLNTELFPFPPNLANTVFFGDILSIVTEDGKALNTSLPIAKGSTPLIVQKGATSHINLVPSIHTTNRILHDEVLVYGDRIVLVISGMSYVARAPSVINKENAIVWKERLGVSRGTEGPEFRIVPIDGKRKLGDFVTYGDRFGIEYSKLGMVAVNDSDPAHSFLYIDNSPELATLMGSLHQVPEKEERKKMKIGFKFVSRMEGYYCEDKQCKAVPIRDITPVPFPGEWDKSPPKYVLSSGTYKGKSVFVHQGCWGICDYIETGKEEDGPLTLTEDHFAEFSTTSPPPPWEGDGLFKGKESLPLIFLFVTLIILVIIIGVYVYVKYRHRR